MPNLRSVKRIEIIEVMCLEGEGTSESPYREVRYLFELDGTMILGDEDRVPYRAERRPFFGQQFCCCNVKHDGPCPSNRVES